jgi:hypothetical protein
MKRKHKNFMEMVIFNKKFDTKFLPKSLDSYSLIYGSSNIKPLLFHFLKHN